MQISKLMVFPGYCNAMFPFLKAAWLIDVQVAGAFPDKEQIKTKLAAFCKAVFAGLPEDGTALQFSAAVVDDLYAELEKEGAITAAQLQAKSPQEGRMLVDDLLKEKWGA